MRLPQIKISPYRYVTLPAQGMFCLPPNTRYPPINKFSGVYVHVIEMFFVLWDLPDLFYKAKAPSMSCILAPSKAFYQMSLFCCLTGLFQRTKQESYY